MIDDDVPATQLSDEEAEAWRHARFGELPARVTPDEWVGEVETDLPAHELEQSMPIVQHPGRLSET